MIEKFKRLSRAAQVTAFLAFLFLLVGLSVAASPMAATERISILCATEWNPCVESHNGADIVVYSDAGTTQKFLVDGATGNTTIAGNLTATGAFTPSGVLNQAINIENTGSLPTIVTKAITYTAAAGGSGVVATVGAGEIWLVHEVIINVTTSFTATGDDATLVVGDGNDADGFCVLADAELQIADTEGTGWAAGWQCQKAATIGVYTDENQGFIYSGSETIDYLIDETTGTTLSAGAATIYVYYTRIQ